MRLFEKLSDIYYDLTFRVQDTVDTIKYKVQDLVAAVRGHKSELDNYVSEELFVTEEPVKKTKKRGRKPGKKKNK